MRNESALVRAPERDCHAGRHAARCRHVTTRTRCAEAAGSRRRPRSRCTRPRQAPGLLPTATGGPQARSKRSQRAAAGTPHSFCAAGTLRAKLCVQASARRRVCAALQRPPDVAGSTHAPSATRTCLTTLCLLRRRCVTAVAASCHSGRHPHSRPALSGSCEPAHCCSAAARPQTRSRRHPWPRPGRAATQ